MFSTFAKCITKVVFCPNLLAKIFLLCAIMPSCWASSGKSILILKTIDLPLLEQGRIAFEEQLQVKLREQVNDSVIHFDVKDANGDFQSAVQTFQQVLAAEPEQHPDLIVTIATLATRAAIATRIHEHIPVIFLFVSDPINEGIVSEFGHNSPFNITGETHVVSEQVKLATFDMLAKSNTPVFADQPIMLLYSSYPSALSTIQSLILNTKSTRPDFFQLVSTPFIEGEVGERLMQQDVKAQLEILDTPVKYYWMESEPLSLLASTHQMLRTEFGITQVFAEDIAAVKAGALMGISADPKQIGLNASKKAYSILFENKAANDFPVTRTDDFQLCFNLSTALAEDVVIPSALLRLAGDNIFR